MTRMPDFIIAGAMKSGTTWLHDALNSLPGVVLPREEVHWLDAHDFTAHPDFAELRGDGLHLASGETSTWYQHHTQYSGNEILGYDATTLFHSKVDFRDLAKRMPETKIVVILRHPVHRAYSHYWHLVRTGRATHSFEKELLYGKCEIIDRSLYFDQARRLKETFGNRVRFICYEKLFSEPEVELSGLLTFLDIDDSYTTALHEYLSRPSNPGRYPRFKAGWLMGAQLLAGLEKGRYARDVGTKRASLKNQTRYALYWGKLAVMSILAGGVTRRKPKMKPKTNESLSIFFEEANRGLDEFTGWCSYSAWWK